MPQDAFALNHLTKELNFLLKDSKVNKIVQLNNDEVVLTLYTGKRTEKLSINVNPASPRISVVEEDKVSLLTAPNFCMLLRKHLLGATLKNISLVGFDRIVKIEFLTSNELLNPEERTLYVELMGRYSNVILTKNGKILGGNRGINNFDNGVRPLICGNPYVFPPTNNKLLPTDKEIVSLLSNKTCENLEEFLFKNVQGLALATCKEIIYRYNEKYGKINLPKDSENLFYFINDFIYNSNTNACIVKEDNQIKDVLCLDYKTIAGEREFFSSLYIAENYYYTNKERQKNFTNIKDRLLNVLSTAIKKIKKKISLISSKKKDALSAEENRLKGELILSNIYKIKPNDESVICQNYYDDNKEIVIALDKTLSASDNANKYYKKYNKQKRTLLAIEPQLQQAQNELNYYNSVVEEVNSSESLIDLNNVSKELEEYGLIKEEKTKKKKEVFIGYREYVIDGSIVRVGKNNIENDKLLSTAKGNDLWLHVKDYHSSHVIILNNGKVTEKVLLTACEICAYYSNCKESGKVQVDYTYKKHVKKPKGAKPGFVTYTEQKTLSVFPKKHTELIKIE